MLDTKTRLAEEFASKNYNKNIGQYSNRAWEREKEAFIAGWEACFAEIAKQSVRHNIEKGMESQQETPFIGKTIC